MSASETFWSYFPLVMFLAIGTGIEIFLGRLVWNSGYSLYETIQSKDWPSTNGTVSKSRLSYDSEGDRYDLEVKYDYAVNGKTYAGERFSLWHQRRSSTAKAEDERLAQYAPGTSVTVYYNPAAPERSALILPPPNVHTDPLFLVAAAGLLVPFGIMCFLAYALFPIALQLRTGWPK